MPQRIAPARYLAAIVAALAGLGPAGAVDLEAAHQQFVTSCGVCHTTVQGEPQRQGPSLHGVFGRQAGRLAGFAYSNVLKAGGWRWDEATLDPWIADAHEAHPGTTMVYRQADPAKRALIIEYLKSLSPAE